MLFHKSSKSHALMDRRNSERVSTNIDARFFHGNMFYSGRVLNVSEKGLFINTKKCLPSNTMFVVIIHMDNELFKVVAKVKRVLKHENSFDGMGVELVRPPQFFRDYIDKIKNTN